jgi:hypothetical protein
MTIRIPDCPVFGCILYVLCRFLLGAYQVENRPRLLCFWLSGEGAKKMETLEDQQVYSQDKHFLGCSKQSIKPGFTPSTHQVQL